MTEDCLSDGYFWSTRSGSKRYPEKGYALIIKRYNKIRTAETGRIGDERFKRYYYRLLGQDGEEDFMFTLVHYIGDEKVYKDLRHGNSKKNQRPYIRTAASTLRRMEKKKTIFAQPQLVYQEMKEEGTIGPALMYLPRNCKQVANRFAIMEAMSPFGKDEILLTSQLGFLNRDFFHSFFISYQNSNVLVYFARVIK